MANGLQLNWVEDPLSACVAYRLKENLHFYHFYHILITAFLQFENKLRLVNWEFSAFVNLYTKQSAEMVEGLKTLLGLHADYRMPLF